LASKADEEGVISSET